MKNIKLTKDMKHEIAYAMYNVYHSKRVNYWCEFIPEIKSYCPMVTQVLHWSYNQIKSNITDSDWFKHYILTKEYR